MTLHPFVLAVIAACAAATVVPRILPFLAVRRIRLPDAVAKWLSFIPICVLTALTVGSFVNKGEAGLAVDWAVLGVVAPTLGIAAWTKKLSVTVVSGVLLMAAVRLLERLL